MFSLVNGGMLPPRFASEKVTHYCSWRLLGRFTWTDHANQHVTLGGTCISHLGRRKTPFYVPSRSETSHVRCSTSLFGSSEQDSSTCRLIPSHSKVVHHLNVKISVARWLSRTVRLGAPYWTWVKMSNRVREPDLRQAHPTGPAAAGVSVSNKQLNFLTLWVINMSEGTARSLARLRYKEGHEISFCSNFQRVTCLSESHTAGWLLCWCWLSWGRKLGQIVKLCCKPGFPPELSRGILMDMTLKWVPGMIIT